MRGAEGRADRGENSATLSKASYHLKLLPSAVTHLRWFYGGEFRPAIAQPGNVIPGVTSDGNWSYGVAVKGAILGHDA
jgi:hypothetical protein